MGKFHRILEPGLNILLPVVDKVKYVQSLKEIAIDVPKQSAITSGKCQKYEQEFQLSVSLSLCLDFSEAYIILSRL
jgi:hypothetical protein